WRGERVKETQGRLPSHSASPVQSPAGARGPGRRRVRNALRHHHLHLAAWLWAEHRDRRNRLLHALTGSIGAACLLLLLGRVGLFWGLSLAEVAIALASLYFLALDEAASLSLIALGLILRTALGGAFRIPGAGAGAGLALPLLGFTASGL